MTSQYATIPSQYSISTDFTIAVTSGGGLSSGSKYFYIQGFNRAGKNLLSASQNISYLINQKIVFTITPNTRSGGEDLHGIIISSSTTNDPATATQIAKLRLKNIDQITNIALPTIIELTQNSHLITATIANSAALPTGANLINGMIRYITDIATYKEYNDNLSTWNEVIGINANPPTLTNILNTSVDGGCDRQLALITAPIIPPVKIGNADSTPILFHLSNGLTEDAGSPLPIGSNINLKVTVDGQSLASDGASYNSMFSGLIVVELLGYYRRSSRVLDDTILGINGGETWDTIESPMTLAQALPRGYAAVYSLLLRFPISLLVNRLSIINGASIEIDIIDQGLFGKPSSIWYAIGDSIFNTSDLLRIVPGYRLGGIATIKKYEFPIIGEQSLPAFVANTANQLVAISGARAGDVVIRQNTNELLNNEAIRAVVSTESGTANPSAISNNLLVTLNSIIELTITHPFTNNLRGTIRSNYPDQRIANNAKGLASVPSFYIYLILSGTIYRKPAIACSNSPSQVVQISTVLDATVVGSLPTNSSDFSLYQVTGLSLSNYSLSGGLLAAGNYTCYIAYHYPAPNVIPTKIDHNPALGCIPELSSTLAEAIANSPYWSSPILLAIDARQIPLDIAINGCSKRVLATGDIIYYDANSTTTDNGVTVFLPSYLININPGRWLVKSGSGDMQKSVYDIGNNGVVDNSEKLNNQNSGYYLNRANHTASQPSSSISDLADQNTRLAIAKSGSTTGTRRMINFLEGSNISINLNDDSGGEKVDVTLAVSGSLGHTIQADGVAITTRANLNFKNGVIASDSGSSSDINLDEIYLVDLILFYGVC